MDDGLSYWQLGWDQTRARRGNDYVFCDDRVTLATDFECGNGVGPRREDDGYALDLEPEPGEHHFSGKSYYFCCGLRNRTGRPLTTSLRLYGNMNGQFAEGTRSVVLRVGDGWDHLPPERIRPRIGVDAVELMLDLPVDETPLFVSNFYWHPYSDLEAWVQRCRDHPLARLAVLGKSVEGRLLYRLDIGREDSDAPVVIVSQTPQPSEGIGTHVCRALVDYLVGDDPTAVAIRAAQRIIVIPTTNPDGTVLGLGVSHPSGRFPFFEGYLAANSDAAALVEMRAVWEVLVAERPWWFIEWHGNNWARRPGHMLLRYRPELLANAGRRNLWQRIDDVLLALPDTYHGNWTGHQEGIYQSTIGFQAVTRLGTIAHMVKHHDKHGLDDIRRHAVECLRRGIQSLQR